MILVAALVSALSLSLAPPSPPLPDAHPSSCQYGWCAVRTWGAVDYNVPAVNAATGEAVPGMYFRCHVPTRWKGKRNVWGRSVCVLVQGQMP